jgi:hypothetical protein
VNGQPAPLTSQEDAALRPWKRWAIVALVLLGSSGIGILLYVCLSVKPNLWILFGWIGGSSVALRFGPRFANRRADQIIKSVSDENSQTP